MIIVSSVLLLLAVMSRVGEWSSVLFFLPFISTLARRTLLLTYIVNEYNVTKITIRIRAKFAMRGLIPAFAFLLPLHDDVTSLPQCKVLFFFFFNYKIFLVSLHDRASRYRILAAFCLLVVSVVKKIDAFTECWSSWTVSLNSRPKVDKENRSVAGERRPTRTRIQIGFSYITNKWYFTWFCVNLDKKRNAEWKGYCNRRIPLEISRDTEPWSVWKRISFFFFFDAILSLQTIVTFQVFHSKKEIILL